MSEKDIFFVEVEGLKTKTIVKKWDNFNGKNEFVRLSFDADFLDAQTAQKFAASLVNHVTPPHVRTVAHKPHRRNSSCLAGL